MSPPRVSDVFTPAKPVRPQMFAERRSDGVQGRVEAALLEPGVQLVLHGPTGVGKTSLVRNVCERLGLTRVELSAGAPFGKLVEDALAEIAQRAPQAVDTATTGGGSIAVGAAPLRARAEGKVEETFHEVIRSRSASRELLYAMERTGTDVLFVDNFEAAERQDHYDETVVRLGELLKAFSDRDRGDRPAPKLVVAGIPSAAEELVALEQAVARRTAQIKVPRMTEDELVQILLRGELALGVEFDDGARDAIVGDSDGFPYFTHLLAKHAVQAALAAADDGFRLVRRRTRVTHAHFRTGLARAVDDSSLELKSQYAGAVAAAGQRQGRRLVLEALARLSESEGDLKTIRASHLAVYPHEKDNTRFVSRALRDLVERDRILARRRRAGRGQVLYRFRNPLMRPYVRIHERYALTPPGEAADR